MRTSFTATQLQRPEIASADAILQTCVHYGFCTAGCPTYILFRDENDSTAQNLRKLAKLIPMPQPIAVG